MSDSNRLRSGINRFLNDFFTEQPSLVSVCFLSSLTSILPLPIIFGVSDMAGGFVKDKSLGTDFLRFDIVASKGAAYDYTKDVLYHLPAHAMVRANLSLDCLLSRVNR